MRYFLDTEFLEGPQKKWFGKTKPTIDLISIGIVCEDDREYYAVSKDFNLKQAWKDKWIQENVLLPIYKDWVHGDMRNYFPFSYGTMKGLVKHRGKSNEQIAIEIIEFTHKEVFDNFIGNEVEFHNRTKEYGWNLSSPIEFYAYYADYDWVVFCWLFGRMIDLPKGFPMYCRDLKQMLDEKIDFINHSRNDKKSPLVTPKTIKENNPDYPKQNNEHNALSDAKWNFELYKFLKNL